jgi:hypothetical protein
MGYNTTVVVLNDALSFIENDPEFGRNLARAIMEAATNGGKPVNVPARSSRGGVHCNAATVIETHHADYSVLVKVGQNYGEALEVDSWKKVESGLRKPKTLHPSPSTL